ASGADWHAPESWGVQPIASPIGPLQKSLTSTPEDISSDEMDYSDSENWNYGQRKCSTVRIFRPDTTYTTMNCEYFVQNCISLKDLRMAYNDLIRIPSNVRYITNLQLLDARGNRIRDLEKAYLERASKLHTLNLQCNRLYSIPSSFKALQNLRIINLSSNNFSDFPDVLCSIVSLEELDLSFNSIAEIPHEISNLVHLKTLLLYGNRIMPHLPKSMESLISLRKLDIRQNGLLNLDVLNGLPALEELLVDYNTNVLLNNSFSALVRASIVKCSMTDINLRGTGDTLVFLDLSSNKLSNLTPGFFEHLVCLETLRLDNNSISSIPSTVCALKRLKILSVANNSLSSLPDEIAQLESLTELDVHSNSIGELPSSIWGCSLTTLNATSNLLESFPDPPESNTLQPATTGGALFSSSSSTVTLCETDSQTSAQSKTKPLPSTPIISSNLANTLETLCLGDNHLPGEVFYALSHFASLKTLNLSHNSINEIPRGQIPNPGCLLELYLSGNKLTNLPADDIEPLRNLRVLHISGNKLTTLPAELGKINHLKVLDVGCNALKYNISNWLYDWNW
ncbi:cysteinyl-tRNA synthetase, partial [Entomortierella lignicola]